MQPNSLPYYQQQRQVSLPLCCYLIWQSNSPERSSPVQQPHQALSDVLISVGTIVDSTAWKQLYDVLISVVTIIDSTAWKQLTAPVRI